MFDLDKIISEAYGNEPMSFEKLAEMVEDMLVLQESLGLIREESEKTKYKPIDIKWRPYVQMSEIAWGSTKYRSAEPRDVDGDNEISAAEQNPAREQLKRYLSAIPAGNIKEKIDGLNKFIENINSDSPAIDGIGKAVSFMMFYRTLYDIISDFNAAAAGFIFESFLAVLLDADRGHQVPASGAKTIADFIVYPNGGRIPISLKLYAAGSLKVGGSYVQLVEDLAGEFGMMQYIVITKVSGSDKQVQSLKFYSFNFTLDNFAKIINLTGRVGLDQMCLPAGIVEGYSTSNIKNILKQGIEGLGDQAAFKQTYRRAGASELDPLGQYQVPRQARYDIDLDIPSKTNISIRPAYKGISGALDNIEGTPLYQLMKELGQPEPTNATQIKNKFEEVLNKYFNLKTEVDLEFGLSRANNAKYMYTSSGKSNQIKMDIKKDIFAEIYNLLSDEQKSKQTDKYGSNSNPLKKFIATAVAAGASTQQAAPKPEKGQDPRAQRVTAIYGERSDEQKRISVEILKNSKFSKTEKIKLLKLTAGYQGVAGETQFEITKKTAFDILYTPDVAGEGNLPYGAGEDGSFATVSLRNEDVLGVCNTVLNSFNKNMAEALNGMQMLVDDMNAYVISGLNEAKRAEDAVQDAEIVKNSMERQVSGVVTDEDDSETRIKRPPTPAERPVPGGREW